jgi:hypothetical protein
VRDSSESWGIVPCDLLPPLLRHGKDGCLPFEASTPKRSADAISDVLSSAGAGVTHRESTVDVPGVHDVAGEVARISGVHAGGQSLLASPYSGIGFLSRDPCSAHIRIQRFQKGGRIGHVREVAAIYGGVSFQRRMHLIYKRPGSVRRSSVVIPTLYHEEGNR